MGIDARVLPGEGFIVLPSQRAMVAAGNPARGGPNESQSHESESLGNAHPRRCRGSDGGDMGAVGVGCAFEWVGGAGHPQFKQISQLVQERMKAIS